MQEMWRLHLAGELNGPQSLLFQERRPVEELYDTQADPWEIHNLAGDPAHANDLARLRKALDDWTAEVGDMGRIPESEMVRQWYPDGKQPRTAPTLMIPICEASPGIEGAPQGGTFKGPLLLQMHCATQGASIAYTLDQSEKPRWLLYSAPLCMPAGKTTIRAKAIRIGYAESEERVATFDIE